VLVRCVHARALRLCFVRYAACAKVAGCCEENQDLLDWVEVRSFAGGFPSAPLPARACDLGATSGDGKTQDKAALCDKCKAAITIEAEPKEDACEYFVKVPDPADMGDETEVFARNEESAASEIPKTKSFKEKVRINGPAHLFTRMICSDLHCRVGLWSVWSV
jgi:hypothetical protein